MTYLESLFSLEGKKAVVTGAARGNGKAIAAALLGAGAEVVLVDILGRELERTTRFFRAEGLRAVMYRCDVGDRTQVQELVEFLRRGPGRVDVLVNNAGVTFSHPLFDYPDEFWERTYAVNLRAPFELSREIGKLMKRNRSGVIINITSLNAELAFPDNPAYVSFKGALRQLSKSLALDLGRYGIRVNSVGPGYFRTHMTRKSWGDPSLNRTIREKTALRRWGRPEDLAGITILLASDASSYITGQDIYVDGGWLAKGL
ncbi:MAG: SDR family oxidoreductase [Deltaproteobacteria bacterium]|nr:SDR family oxidoreductase [Deltaproteobacteria bacterium]MBW2122944.1 SDR family oxidoreductase [Deltaproteobacteria bacterium]